MVLSFAYPPPTNPYSPPSLHQQPPCNICYTSSFPPYTHSLPPHKSHEDLMLNYHYRSYYLHHHHLHTQPPPQPNTHQNPYFYPKIQQPPQSYFSPTQPSVTSIWKAYPTLDGRYYYHNTITDEYTSEIPEELKLTLHPPSQPPPPQTPSHTGTHLVAGNTTARDTFAEIRENLLKLKADLAASKERSDKELKELFLQLKADFAAKPLLISSVDDDADKTEIPKEQGEEELQTTLPPPSSDLPPPVNTSPPTTTTEPPPLPPSQASLLPEVKHTLEGDQKDFPDLKSNPPTYTPLLPKITSHRESPPPPPSYPRTSPVTITPSPPCTAPPPSWMSPLDSLSEVFSDEHKARENEQRSEPPDLSRTRGEVNRRETPWALPSPP